MKKILIVFWLLLGFAGLSYGQYNRWDGSITTTNVPNPTPGNMYPLFALPGSSVAICTYPSNAGINQACTNYATTYQGPSGPSCPSNTQLTPPNGTTCSGTADAQGNFGVWVAAGSYVYTITTSYGTFGPYAFGVDAAGSYCPQSGCTFTGNINTDGINGLPNEEYHTTSANGPLLSNYWRYLHSAPVYTGSYESAGMDVIFPNDSLWEGDWTNSTGCGGSTAVPQYSQNRQAEQIRIALQSQYGYGGTGLQPLINVANCTSVINPELYTPSPSTITTSSIIGPQYGTEYSLVQMSSGQVITWNAGGLPYTFLRTYCADNASSNPITVAIDGNASGTACGTHNSVPIARVITSTGLQPYTNHSATFTCATSPCFIYGVEGRPSLGAGNGGVRVHNVATGGATSAWFVGHTDFEDLISNGVGSNGSAQLIIYAMGTNDADLGVPVATYTANFEAYFAHELAKTPEPPVIVIYRPGLDVAPSQPYFAALTAYGYANNMLVIDQTNRWGTACTTGCWWLGNDNLHFNDGGNLDASHTILNALTDVIHSQLIEPTYGDTGLNPGHVWLDSGNLTAFTTPPGFGWKTVAGIPAMTGWYGMPSGSTYAGDIALTSPKLTFPALLMKTSTGEIDTTANVLDDGLGNMGAAGSFHSAGYYNYQSTVITTLSGAGSGGSFSAFACDSGFFCTAGSGSVTGTMGTAPSSGDYVKIAWTIPLVHKPICTVQAFDNTSATTLTTFIQDSGNTTTTQIELYSSSGATAGHSISIKYSGCS